MNLHSDVNQTNVFYWTMMLFVFNSLQ